MKEYRYDHSQDEEGPDYTMIYEVPDFSPDETTEWEAELLAHRVWEEDARGRRLLWER